jgi:competence CoiA-like predicted nuclease
MVVKRERRYWCPSCKRVIIRCGRKTHRSFCEKTGRDVLMRKES